MSIPMQIATHRIASGNPVYIIAEMSANHRHSLERAAQILEAAASAGADAIKLQTYTADTLTLDCDNDCFRIKGTPWNGKTLHELYREAYTPWEWHEQLKEKAAAVGLDFFSTPFDATAVDFLEDLGVPAYKVASFEIVDIPLLQRIGKTAKPVIMSTGLASRDEIEQAVTALRTNGCDQIALLKCTSAYPSEPGEMNLRTIPDIAESFDVPVGLSDHSPGHIAAIAAVALGACIIEKHLTMSREVESPDSAFSLEPAEFKELVDAVRTTESALGHISYEPTEHERSTRVFRRSLFVVQDMEAGDLFSSENVKSIRPADGLPPKHLQAVLGRRASRDIGRGTPLDRSLISGWDV